MNEEKHKDGGEKQPKDQRKSHASDLLFLRRAPAILRPIRRLFESPQRLVVKNGQVVVDLGCGSGYYTFALAKLAGSFREYVRAAYVAANSPAARRKEKNFVIMSVAVNTPYIIRMEAQSVHCQIGRQVI